MSPSPPTRRVLLVEDGLDDALLLRTFLGALEGYRVTHTQDGDHGIRQLETGEWDLLISDLNLPGTDGFAVIRRARELNPALPILATTGYTGSAYQDQAFRAGATDLMNKPVDRDDFLARIVELVGSQASGPTVGSVVLAVGGLPGDVEMGCGGTLMAARAAGQEVLIVPLCRDERGTDGASLRGAETASRILGATLVMRDGAMEHTTARVALLESLVTERRPVAAYLPAMDESHPARMEAFRIAKAATARVGEVYGYQTATTGLDFRPDRWVEVGEQMVMKMEALAAYGAAGAGRVDLSPRLAQAYARFWGRFEGFTEVEPFEVLRSGEASS